MAFQPVPSYADPAEVDPKTGKFVFSPVWLSWFLTLTTGGLSSTIQHNSTLGLQGGATGQYYHLTTTDFNNRKIRNTSLPSNIVPTGSPFTYQNTNIYDLDVIVQGGTVTKIEFTRDNSNFYDVGLTQGMYRLSPNDRLKVTYTGAPTMTGIPR